MVVFRQCLICIAVVFLTGSVALAKTAGPLRKEVKMVVIHAIGGPMCKNNKVVFTPSGSLESMKRYFERHKVLGIHYLIGRDGTIAKSIPENQVANHAYGHNRASIGIELINRGDGNDPFPDAQIISLIELLKGILKRHNLSIENIKGHADIDTRTFKCGGKKVKEKQDPGANFPWGRVRRELGEKPSGNPN